MPAKMFSPVSVGEILVRTEAAMIGYWKEPEISAATMEGGFIHRRRSGAGSMTMAITGFVGRKKEIIIRAGSNISPLEVEEILYSIQRCGSVASSVSPIRRSARRYGFCRVDGQAYGDRLGAFRISYGHVSLRTKFRKLSGSWHSFPRDQLEKSASPDASRNRRYKDGAPGEAAPTVWGCVSWR